LIRLRERLDREGVADAPVTLFGQVARLEDRLILTPLARRQAGVSLVPSTGAESKPTNGAGTMTKAERERLLRG
jgi:hypothetical protein